MDEKKGDRIETLFHQAVDLPPEERQTLLDAACANDPGLRAALDRLLADDARLGSDACKPFLESPLVRPALPPTLIAAPDNGQTLPPRVGRYRVLRLLGEGGMGAVYEAEQDTPRRIVALKVVRPGLASALLLKRFRHESQILGRLHHPGIAQVYEAGLADDGQPFFAMEFIRGETLDEYARLRALTLPARLELLARVCDAVQHAHEQGVIHRDLKPANILVEETGQPKVLDFGVARATGADLLTGAGLTQTGQLLGTPNYMSPEQVTGDPAAIDHRADVYALGVILFELAAHRLPHRLENRPLAEAARIILEEDPPRLGSINRELRGDVETIVAKALEKDPARRYPSAADLAADLRRLLAHEPILARPTSALYHLRKFIRRRPGLAGSLAAVFVLLVAVAVISTIAAVQLQRRQNALLAAEKRRTVALVDSLLTSAPESVPNILGTLGPDADVALPLLRDHFNNPDADRTQRLRAAVGLTALGEPHTDFLLDAVPDARPAESGNLALAFRSARDPDLVEKLLRRSQEAPDFALRARHAILLLDLDDPRGAQALLAPSPDPTGRSTLIDILPSWHGDLAALPGLLRRSDDEAFRSGLCAAVGRTDPAQLTAEVRRDLTGVLAELYQTAPEGGTHSAAGWMLRRWGVALPTIDPAKGPADGRRWYANGSGLTMIEVPPGAVVFTAAPEIRVCQVVTRPYFLSDCEVSVALFEQFLKDPDYPAKDKPQDWPGPDKSVAPLDTCPVNNVNRDDMILFCNWLSRREGRTPCYKLYEKPAMVWNRWTWDQNADGYRLPIETEWDHANRAGATTVYPFGGDARWLPSYAHVASLTMAPCGEHLPNRWGLFDMVGNVCERCWNRSGLPNGNTWFPSRNSTVFNLTGPAFHDTNITFIVRGGAYNSGTSDTSVDWRSDLIANLRSSTLGFRVACGAVGSAAMQPGDDPREWSNAYNLAVAAMPNTGAPYRDRCDFRVRTGRWREATDDLVRAFELDPANVDHVIHGAVVWLQAGDPDGYRRYCDRLWRQYGSNLDPVFAERMIKTCLLAPVDGDHARLTRYADRAFAVPSPQGHAKYAELARGLLDYREGRYAAALGRLRKSQDESPPAMTNGHVRLLAAFFEAMALHRLEQPAKAREVFDKAVIELKRQLAHYKNDPPSDDWSDVLASWVVYREARALIAPDTADLTADAFLHRDGARLATGGRDGALWL
jgi:formylglycine-generating enzyme required for sulfatase activity/predicted Ser/Thr protein kinase/tetratricopeptide (TPR) repeat protein